jgi:hypothetical protein
MLPSSGRDQDRDLGAASPLRPAGAQAQPDDVGSRQDKKIDHHQDKGVVQDLSDQPGSLWQTIARTAAKDQWTGSLAQ